VGPTFPSLERGEDDYPIPRRRVNLSDGIEVIEGTVVPHEVTEPVVTTCSLRGGGAFLFYWGGNLMGPRILTQQLTPLGGLGECGWFHEQT